MSHTADQVTFHCVPYPAQCPAFHSKSEIISYFFSFLREKQMKISVTESHGPAVTVIGILAAVLIALSAIP
jgi:hypothetical protein